jgi:energy-coupling factor transporter ATP-binding protein EcfA2
MNKTKGIKLKQPTSMWTKPVKLKLSLFKGLFNLAKDFITKQWTKLPSDAIDTISSIQLKTEAGERGWQLVVRSLSIAMMTLVMEHIYKINVDAVISDDLDRDLNEILAQEDHYIGFDFLKNPKGLKLLEKVGPVFCGFLVDVGFEPAIADNICHRLDSYFVFALKDEWHDESTYYAPLIEALKTPLDESVRKELEWNHYLAYLEKQIDEPVFDESFSLKQIYMPLRAYYKEKIKEKNDGDKVDFQGREEEKVKKVTVKLEEDLMEWLDRADKDNALRIITGGPGMGKSSFLKILAAKLAEQYKRVLFIPLHRFAIKDDLEKAIQRFVKDNGYLSHNPMEDKDGLILIFDGLDELAMQGKVLADGANSFIREIKMKLGSVNNSKTRLMVVISERDIIMQANESEFRKEKQVLSILPYFTNEEKREEYREEKDILKTDQRDSWWKNYGALKGTNHKGLPKELKTSDLDQITALPLLNYLVALSFERGKVKFSEHTNLNEIYNDLLKAVHERSYEKKRVHRSVDKLDYEYFVHILEEIAIAAWHGDGRTTTVNEIENHMQDSKLGKVLEKFKTSAKGGIVSFMTAFYFRKAGSDSRGDETFEFTHKSFGEFLAARRIVKKVKQIHKKRQDYEKSTIDDEGCSVKECLVLWAKLFGPKVLDDELIKFIRNELKPINQEQIKNLRTLQLTIIQLIDYMLRNGMPMEQLSLVSYHVQNQQAKDAEKALLIILSIIADYTGKISKISWPNSTAFGDWLSRLQGQRDGPKNFILHYLNRLKVMSATLYFKDLNGANLGHAHLENAILQFSILRRANLYGADLRGANLSGANLRRADLREADLRRADLRGAVISKRQIKDARTNGHTKLPDRFEEE